jgi:15-cis-phytoene synthase
MRVFGPKRFPGDGHDSATAIWRWYDACHHIQPKDVTRIRRGEAPEDFPKTTWSRAEAACRKHGIDSRDLADRPEALNRLKGGETATSGGDITAMLELLVGRHARMLASIGGFRGSWQQEAAASFAAGLSILESLLAVRGFSAEGWTLFSGPEMEAAGVTLIDLAGARVPAGYRSLAWKQNIRARHALVGARPLITDMGIRDRLYAKRVWLGALELIHELDKMDFDVWTQAPRLSAIAKARIGIQSIFGRTAFRGA